MIDTLPRSTIAPLRRRAPESPTLWLLLLAGSLLIHMALLLLLRPWEGAVAGSGQGGDGSVAVELVEAVSETGQTSLSGASPQSGTIAPTAIAAAPADPIPEDNQDIQAPPRSPEKPASRSPQTQTPPPAATSPATQTPPNTSSQQSQPEMKLSEKVATSTPPPPAPAPSPAPQPSPSPKPSVPPKPPTGPVQSGQQLPAAPPISEQLKDSGAPSQPGTGVQVSAPVTPATPVTPVSQELRLTIVKLRPVQTRDSLTIGSDVPDRFAQTVSTSASFPEISGLPPCIRGSLGKPLLLRLTIGIDGVPKPVDSSPSQSSSCTIEAVSKFAEGLVRSKIQFRPAQNSGSPVESTIELDVSLSLV